MIAKYLIIIIHLLVILFNSLYPICVQNIKYDYIYIIFIYLIYLHWTFLKGECILSYIFKKLNNNNYELSSDFKNDDFQYLFGDNKHYVTIILYILMIYNIYIIGNRNNIKLQYIIIFIFILIFNGLGIYCFTNHNNNVGFLLYNEVIKIILILFGLFFYANNHTLYYK